MSAALMALVSFSSFPEMLVSVFCTVFVCVFCVLYSTQVIMRGVAQLRR